MKKKGGNKSKSFLCADCGAKIYNTLNFGKELIESDNDYLKFLYQFQHPFFKILKGRERDNDGNIEFYYLFTYIHYQSIHNIYLNLVVESVDPNRATIIFTTPFRGIRFQYNIMVKTILEYFNSREYIKRKRLIESKGISSRKPQFNLRLSRVYHNPETWFHSISEGIYLNLPTAFGILHDIMVNGQKLKKKYFDGTEVNYEAEI